jgi:hypothetical protein
MRTTTYNPSPFEVALANALESAKADLEKHLPGIKISEALAETHGDNPRVKFTITDSDGDPHQLTVQIIQQPDNF